ncbi:MAG: EAL domain-containing protein, partial [Zoogloeaceae bacterium]|nr:EAL domain-containing protein [Zoogloeaceae bacterium]
AAYYLTRGLASLAQASVKASQGDFSQRAPIRGHDEIAMLAVNFNVMMDAAEAHIQSLRDGERRFRAIADYTYAWENWFDASGKLLWINPAVQRMVGYTPEECLAMPDFPLPLIHPDDQELIRYQTQLARDGLSGQDLEIRVLGRDGTHIWAAVSWQPIHDETGVPQGYRSSIRDTTMQHHTTEELSYQAVHDALTGIFNRRAFERRLQQVFEQPKAAPNQPHLAQLPLVVLYVDLDQFKSVNDTCGHEAGDQLLIELTGLLKEQVGPGFLARLGGDEFGIILRCSEEEGLRCAHRILHEVRNYVFQYQGRHFHPGLSIGVAQASEHLDSVSELLMAADAACYAAKERGRNRVELYIRDNEYFRLQREAFRSADHVANALNEERFLLYFQRVESLSPDAPHFAEVLLRMRDSHDCILTPENFLPAAERFNLMSHIDAWVIKNVCRQLSEWETANTLPEARYLSINISGASLSDQEFPDFVLQQISLYDIDPGRLCFEISERCAARYLPQTQAFIHRMRDLGIALALDDFGTGPSSFAHLKQLPVDFLKIDALFIQHLDQDSKDRAVVLSMLQLARLYGLKTVAEFVSNAAILKIVRELEVGYAQGYALHEPEPLPNLVGNGGDDKP